MGDPKKHRPKYSGPMHPWQRSRIEEEKIILREFGLKNKKEIWKMSSKLKGFKDQAKKLIIKKPEQRALEETNLLNKLIRLGLLEKGATRERVLELTNKDILGRRLQTVVFKKGLARSVNQARQLITHGHIFVHGKNVDVPSYLVNIDEEGDIIYSPTSQFNEEMHPERQRIVAKDELKLKQEIKAELKEKLEEPKVLEPKEKVEEKVIEVKEKWDR